MLDKNNIIAVVGASRNPEKYGHRVYMDLKQADYKVYPVNPNADEVLGDKCFPSLTSLPRKPDVVNLVVPPPVTEQTVQECRQTQRNHGVDAARQRIRKSHKILQRKRHPSGPWRMHHGPEETAAAAAMKEGEQ